MEVRFADQEVDRRCRSRKGRQRAWGEFASLLARRLFELTALPSLADVGFLPGVALAVDGQPGRYRIRSEPGIELIVRIVALSGGTQPPEPSTVAKVIVEQVIIHVD
jgi:hypothetical protein